MYIYGFYLDKAPWQTSAAFPDSLFLSPTLCNNSFPQYSFPEYFCSSILFYSVHKRVIFTTSFSLEVFDPDLVGGFGVVMSPRLCLLVG